MPSICKLSYVFDLDLKNRHPLQWLIQSFDWILHCIGGVSLSYKAMAVWNVTYMYRQDRHMNGQPPLTDTGNNTNIVANDIHTPHPLPEKILWITVIDKSTKTRKFYSQVLCYVIRQIMF